MKDTTRAQNLSLDLDHALSIPRIKSVWKNTIRDGLRNQPLKDIHDFLDIHRNIEGIAKRLRKDVLDGHYQPSSPEFVHSEKRDGIPRRLAIPEPEDALVLQCIVEVLEKELEGQQPTNNAFYARGKGPKKGIEHIDGTFAYPWWILWPEFQKRIWEFSESHNFVVVTDIANYFDCIPLAALRNTLASLGRFKENLLNFLFYLLEAFSWRPYYMPHSGVGLPQLNFDAPRLLAHVYLFKVDEELQKETNGDFVRWMDDIDAGVNSHEEGKRLLRHLDNILSSQGLRLNTSKSKILSAKQAVAHFWLQENRTLTATENSIIHGAGSDSSQDRQSIYLRRKFQRFWRKERLGAWDKVLKRYFKLFGLIHDPYLENYIPEILEEIPGLRETVFRYLSAFRPSQKRLEIVENFVLSGHCEDDISLFAAVCCIIDWRTPAQGKLVCRIVTIANKIAKKHKTFSKSGVTAAVWLLAKYGSQKDLMSLISSSRDVWEKSSWLARQIAGITPLLPDEYCELISKAVTQNGLLQALQVLANIRSIKRLTSLDLQLNNYLTYLPKDGFSYPLPKVLIAIAVLNGRLLDEQKEALYHNLLTIVGDRRYEAILRRGISFQGSSHLNV